MNLLTRLPHRSIYLIALVVLAASLPLSYAFMSISQGVLLGNWLLEGRFKERFSRIAHSKSLLLFCCFYLIHIIGMFYTTDLEWGFHDLRIKLPLLIIPLIVATSEQIDKKQLKLILHAFIAGVLIASFIVAAVILHIYSRPWSDIREASIFISHIRFGLLIAIAIFVCFYYALHAIRTKTRWIYFLCVLWLFSFMLLLQALTGLVALFVTLIVIFFVFRNHEPYSKYKITVAFSILIFLGTTLGYIGYAVFRFYDFKPLPKQLPSFTVNGNKYWHDTACTFVENGYKVNVMICEPELRKEWNSRSDLKYNGLDLRKQALRSTLIRYMASRGFNRDSVGISQLSSSDFRNVEAGMGNYIFSEKGIYPKIYSVLWEFYVFDFKGNPSGHSVTQRLLFVKTASEVLCKNIWFGVGTGDIRQAMHDQYELDQTPLSKEFRHRAHNQFLTFAVTFGIPLTLIILAMFILVPYWENKYQNYFFLVVFCVSMISVLNEDTLETHPGVSFVAFFYALFLFGIKKEDELK